MVLEARTWDFRIAIDFVKRLDVARSYGRRSSGFDRSGTCEPSSARVRRRSSVTVEATDISFETVHVGFVADRRCFVLLRGRCRGARPSSCATVCIKLLHKPHTPGCPKLTNEVQHLVKVLSWEKDMDMSPLKRGVKLPDYKPRDTRSAKLRQVWIARHRQWLGS